MNPQEQTMDGQLEQFEQRMRELHATRPHHVVFFNYVQHDLAREMLADIDWQAFYGSKTWRLFLELYNDLARSSDVGTEADPDRMCTIRWPARIHIAIKRMADRRHTSVNKLMTELAMQAIFRDRIEQEGRPDEHDNDARVPADAAHD